MKILYLNLKQQLVATLEGQVARARCDFRLFRFNFSWNQLL